MLTGQIVQAEDQVVMLLSYIASVLALAAAGIAVPAPSEHVLHEKRSTPHTNWVKGARVDRSTFLPMRIGLTQNNLEKGHDWLLEV